MSAVKSMGTKETAFVRGAIRGFATDISTPTATNVRSPQGRMGRVFAEMRTQCREDMTAYASCVESTIDDVRKDSCKDQYAAMRSCFDNLRRVVP